MSKNKKKTAREKRILVGAFLTAVVIAAGSTFAWFTSTDKVTNRLSANADYDVKIVESFAPPENWLPGTKTDKDVYAVNTGNIEAFARATLSGMMSITREVPVLIDDVQVAEPGSIIKSYSLYDAGAGTWGTATPTAPTGGLRSISELPAGVTDPTASLDEKATHFVETEDTTTHEKNYSFYIVTEDDSNATYTWKQRDGVYDCVELNDNEVYVIEAGAFLAYCPSDDHVNYNGGKYGNKAIAFKEKNETDDSTADEYWVHTTAGWVKVDNETAYNAGEYQGSTIDDRKIVKGEPTNATKTDFKPHADGLYVFRRSIVVNTGSDNDLVAGTEQFEYEGYYFLGGRYYKITNLDVTADDDVDFAGDATTKDGHLSDATAYLVREEKQYLTQPDDFTFDVANNRLIALYHGVNYDGDSATNNNNKGGYYNEAKLNALAQALDQAEHNFAEAEVLYRRSLEDANIANDNAWQLQKDVDDAQKEYNEALLAYQQAVTAFNNAVTAYNNGVDEFTPRLTAAQNALKDLVGTGNGSVAIADGISAVDNETATSDATVTPGTATTDWTAADPTSVEAGGATIANPSDGSKANAYGKALAIYNAFVDAHVNENTMQDIYVAYLQELSDDNALSGYTAPADLTTMTPAQLEAEVKRASETITYDYASDHINYSASGASGELHKFHELAMKLKIATYNYENSLSKYESAIDNLNEAIDALNTKEDGAIEEDDKFKKVNITNAVDAAALTSNATNLNTAYSAKAKKVVETYNALTGTGLEDVSALATILEVNPLSPEEVIALNPCTSADSTKEYKLWKAYQDLTEAEGRFNLLEDKIWRQGSGANEYPTTILVYADLANKTVDQIMTDYHVDDPAVAQNLKNNAEACLKAKNAVDLATQKLAQADTAYDADGDIVIYIYLKNVSLTGDEAGKWQILPDDLSGGKAIFYYTSLLGAGEVSNQLVDYVELDKSVTQDMYKTFDFDLNIELASVQVSYEDDAATLRSTQAANEEFNGVTGKIKNPAATIAAKDTVVTWSQNATAPTAPGGATYGEPDGAFNALPNDFNTYFDGGAIYGDVTLNKLQAPMQIPLAGNPVVNYSFTHGGKTYYTNNTNGARVYEYTDSWSAVGSVSTV